MEQIILVTLYLGAIIGANLAVVTWGLSAVLPVAFLLIGLDLTSRDYLHELWQKKLWLKMAILIGVGSLLSWLLNQAAGQVAIASFVAFAMAGIVDTLIYQVLKNKAFIWRVNGSNVFSSFTDSALFLTIAFGSFMPVVILTQFSVKVLGGFVWALLLRRLRE
tara:strand:+ start:39 stop:527 length:489 start_codon:yes stop_codon:yes gene_type:complete